MKIKLTEKRLIRLISKYTDINYHEITADTRIKEDLGLSSYDMVCIASEIKDKYKVNNNMTMDKLRYLSSVGDVLAFLNQN